MTAQGHQTLEAEIRIKLSAIRDKGSHPPYRAEWRRKSHMTAAEKRELRDRERLQWGKPPTPEVEARHQKRAMLAWLAEKEREAAVAAAVEATRRNLPQPAPWRVNRYR